MMTKHIGYNTRYNKREVKTPPQIMLYYTSIKQSIMRKFLKQKKYTNKSCHETTNHTTKSKHKSKHKLHISPPFCHTSKRDKFARKLSYSTTQTLSSPHIKENLL